MASPKGAGVAVAVLRDTARAEVEGRSLRQVAAEVGMTAMGLRAFLAGGSPQPATHRKLTEWYLRHAADRRGALSVATARAVLSMLVAHLPADRRDAEAARLVDSIAETTNRAGVPAPRWLRAVGEGGEET